MWKILGTKPRHTTPYHPQANLTERVNRVLGTMLKIYAHRHQTTWDVRLPELEFAVNTAYSESTGLAPCEILFGRMLNDPTTLQRKNLDGVGTPTDSEIVNFTRFLRQRLESAVVFVRENLVKAMEKQKAYYDLRRRESPFKVGDLVWKDSHKLSDASKQFTAKLAVRREGPYEIAKMVSENVAILKTQGSKKDFGPVNVVHLTPYNKPVIDNPAQPEPFKLTPSKLNGAVTIITCVHPLSENPSRSFLDFRNMVATIQIPLAWET